MDNAMEGAKLQLQVSIRLSYRRTDCVTIQKIYNRRQNEQEGKKEIGI